MNLDRQERETHQLSMQKESLTSKTSTPNEANDRAISSNIINERNIALLRKGRKLLYTSHLFSQFSEVAWQFCLTLFLASYTNYESLILVSTYGLVSGICVFLFLGSQVGHFIDSTNHTRLFIAQCFIWTENSCVLLATICCYFLMESTCSSSTSTPDVGEADEPSPPGDDFLSSLSLWVQSHFYGVSLDVKSVVLLILIHLLGATAQVLDSGFLVAIERDWVVVMSEFHHYRETQPSSVSTPLISPPSSRYGSNDDTHHADDTENPTGNINRSSTVQMKSTSKILLPSPSPPQVVAATISSSSSSSWLSDTNVTMKQIDLSCKVVAPAIAGFYLGFFDINEGTGHHGCAMRGAAIIVGLINIIALTVEYYCTLHIYRLIPTLAAARKTATRKAATQSTTETSQLLGDHNNAIDPEQKCENGGSYTCGGKSCSTLDGLKIYMEQGPFLGGIGLSLLYLNVLTFGAIMTAYLAWRGMRFETVGIWRGISSCVGLLGTVAFHLSYKHMPLVSCGMWSIVLQFSCLSVSYASLYVLDYNTSLSMLIGGVCLSRIGLWVFDITMTQLMQENVKEDVRGVVGGVQQSLNAFFGLLSFGLGVILPNPNDFPIYVASGYVGVGIAMLLYGFGVYSRQDQLTK